MVGFMSKFHNSKFYPIFQRILRALQFLSALSSLVVFSIRIRRLLQLYNGVNRAEGAVLGIIAAAVAYTLAVLILNFLLKSGASKMLRWVLVALDIAFVGAFIAVSVLTSPKNGRAGPCVGERKRQAEATNFENDAGCQLPLGTFVTAIISTVLHALTAIFQNTREHIREHRLTKEERSYNSSPNRNSTNAIDPNHTHHHSNGVNNTTHNNANGFSNTHNNTVNNGHTNAV